MSERDIEQRLAEHIPASFMCQQILFCTDIDISEYELAYLFGVQKDETIVRSDLKKGILNLFKKNRFEKIDIQLLQETTNTKLHIALTGFWTLGSCTISGFFRGKGLYRRAYTLERGDAFTIEKHQRAVDNLKKTMHDGGFFAYTLSDEVHYDTTKKEASVKISLQPGKQFFVKDAALVVKGDSINVHNKSIIEKIEQKYVHSLVRMPFSQQRMMKVLLELEQAFHEAGLFHSCVTLRKKINIDKQEIKIGFCVDLTKSKQFVFKGNKYFSSEQLLESFRPFGELVTCIAPAILVQELQSVYYAAGFVHAVIEASEDDGQICFDIREGSYACVEKTTTVDEEVTGVATNFLSVSEENCAMRFGKTIVRGCPGIPFYCIERELPYKTGECWDPEKLQQTFSCLRTLDMFQHIYVHPDDPTRVDDEKAVILDLTAAPVYELLLRGGVGLQQVGKQYWFGRGLAYTVGGSFTQRNVTNHADTFLLNVDISPLCRDMSASYTVPWLWHLPVRTTGKIFSSTVEAPTCLSDGTHLWRARKEGFLMSFQKSSEGLDAHVNVGFESVGLRLHCPQLVDSRVVCQASVVDDAMLGCRVPYFFIEPSLVLTYSIFSHDTPSQPLTFLSAKIGCPLNGFADAYFIKLLVEQSLFFPVKSILGAVRLRLGHIFTPCFAQLSPLERFFCGGMRSVRSYEADQCPPYGCFFDGGECKKIVQGGRTIAVLNAEVRIPLVRELTGVVFQDIGTLMGARVSDWNVRDNVLLGTGFGLRYHTPIGPLSFDVGFRWRSKEEGLRYAWFLSFGETF